uniref:Uncharacterized protein n=1 Tax=Alternaria alternata TaxID=5599 RepID=A0A3G9HK32_ALTAL|nr:hypothetical protein [Alternaria alternata]
MRDATSKKFHATGVWLIDAQIVLKRFDNHTAEQAKAVKSGQQGDDDSWTQLRNSFGAAVAEKAKVEVKQLSQGIQWLQVNNALLHDRNQGLQQEINAKSKQKLAIKTLNLQQRKEYHGSAVFWSLRKIREARTREAVRQDNAEQQRLQMSRDRNFRTTATAYKKQQQEAAKVARQRAAEERRELKKARAAKLAAGRALKKPHAVVQKQSAKRRRVPSAAGKQLLVQWILSIDQQGFPPQVIDVR